MQNKILDIFYHLKKKSKLSLIPLHEPDITYNEKKIVNDILKSGFISTAGKEIDILEKKIQEYTKVKNIILTNSGTSALHLIIYALGIKDNEEIIVPSATFVGTINPILYCNAVPNFVDIDLSTYSISPKKLEDYLNKNAKIVNGKCINTKTKRRIKALIVVHVFGNISNIIQIKKIFNKFNLYLIEDAAEAFGSRFQNKLAGSFGIASAYSFNGNKIISTGAGGAIVTNNNRLASKIRHLSTTSKLTHKFQYIHDRVGFNYRMPNINASLGISQINRIEKFISQKRKLHKLYVNLFKNFEDIELLTENENCYSNYWLNCIILKKINLKTFNSIISKSIDMGFIVRPMWKPMHTLKFCRHFPRSNLDNTMKAYKTSITLPSSANLYEKFK